MAKKKLEEKVDSLKTLLENLNIDIKKDQLDTFVKNHEALISGKIKEETIERFFDGAK